MSFPTDSVEEFVSWFIITVFIITIITLGAFGFIDILWVLLNMLPRG